MQLFPLSPEFNILVDHLLKISDLCLTLCGERCICIMQWSLAFVTINRLSWENWKIILQYPPLRHFWQPSSQVTQFSWSVSATSPIAYTLYNMVMRISYNMNWNIHHTPHCFQYILYKSDIFYINPSLI